MKGLTLFALAVVVVAGTTAGCGSGGKQAAQSELPTKAKLVLDTKSTGGKALVLTATTDKKLASQKGSLYALELQGIDSASGDSSFDKPAFTDPNRCIGGSSCVWTVVPPRAGKFEYRMLLLDLIHNSTAGQSNTVQANWASPPRPRAIKLYVNGKTPPTVPLSGDDYGHFPSGPMDVEAKWLTDAAGTGYYVTISIADQVYASCSAGTSCRVPKKLPLAPGTEVSWTVQLMTKQGNKVAGGFKVCLKGTTKPKST